MENTASIKDFRFFFAGKAIFTVSNSRGDYFTYKVVKKEANARFQTECFMIMVMNGPDNETSYAYMGLLNRNGEIKLTKGSKVDFTDPRYQVAKWALRKAMLQEPIAPGSDIRHAGSCCVCGRTLTTPESIAKGIGPKCESRW